MFNKSLSDSGCRYLSIAAIKFPAAGFFFKALDSNDTILISSSKTFFIISAALFLKYAAASLFCICVFAAVFRCFIIFFSKLSMPLEYSSFSILWNILLNRLFLAFLDRLILYFILMFFNRVSNSGRQPENKASRQSSDFAAIA